MLWAAQSPYCLRSGAYRIAIITVMDEERYELWFRNRIIGWWHELDEAKARAEEHAREREGR